MDLRRGVSGQGGTQPHSGIGDGLHPPGPTSKPRFCLSSPVQVGKLDGDVVVKCSTTEQRVTWTQNGEPEPMAELVAEGQTLMILGLDLPATGNYSCWAGSVLLDSIYVVVTSTREEGVNVSCQAESYRGSFRCSWAGPRSAVFRARLTHSDGSLGEWVPASRHRGRFYASFVDPFFCPFAEELHPLRLQLEGLSDTSYINFSSHFFIRDIVRPDPPQELAVQRRGEQLHLAWAPPASWPLPRSYFALLYRLQYELPNGTQADTYVEGAEETWLRDRARRVRISCRDPYTSPAWSPWSPWHGTGAAQQRRLQAP
ncbi:interleukin-12 subunit beta-like [Strigops habroptila]|uniref:interleukin-12 subunit beta-like n=1 Tax=Strigops habroptila TaxID=2489341 RepID=UPI0011CFC72E|nr:interleukin-12 subunit beta-like [Strigops habroptila]